jgi:hypothetical protein
MQKQLVDLAETVGVRAGGVGDDGDGEHDGEIAEPREEARRGSA